MSLSEVMIVVAAVTDVGIKREVNEDSYFAQSPLFVVADGMGGYEAGDQASAAVIDAFCAHVKGPAFPTLAHVRAALSAADLGVTRVAATTSRGAGSTVTGLVLVEHEAAPHWLIFNVGDSRVYRHTGSELQQLTVDHSLGQELVERGEMKLEDLFTFDGRNIITRAIGAAESAADSWLMPVVNGERILICSDGLTSEVQHEAIRAILTMGGSPSSVATALVARAVQNGGRDNVTVIVLDVLAGGMSQARSVDAALVGLGEMIDSALTDTTIQI